MLSILYYHEVVDPGHGFSYQKIDLDKFSSQMQYLHENGYQTLHFSQLNQPLPEKAVIVSFDDGFRSVYQNAASIMQEYGIVGNIYLPTAYIEKYPQFMDWNMVRQLQGLFEFQAHTHNHLDIRTLSKEQLNQEIALSDAEFIGQLHWKPSVFCMPYGVFDHKSIYRLRSTHRYRFLLGSFYGTVKHAGDGAILPRIGISNDDTLDIFQKKLEGKLNWKGSLQRARLMLQNIKGERITDYLYD